MRDPFHETAPSAIRKRLPLLGGLFEFHADSVRLSRLVDSAYARLPHPRLKRSLPRFELRMTLRPREKPFGAGGPPPPRTQAGSGMICAVVDAANFATLHAATRRGLIAMSGEMLRFPYHARYELLEFAVFTLASRAQGLVPLHAACVGSNGRALLLVGESGAGKSTLTLQCMLQGMELLAEDAVFVQPRSLLVTGVPNFLHLRRDSLRFIEDGPVVRHIRRSRVIQRRSGVRKFEVDVRDPLYRIARAPMRLAGVVFVSQKRARGQALLSPVDRVKARARLARSQEYAAGLSSWAPFMSRLEEVAAFELRRAAHPREAARALVKLLDWGLPHRQALAADPTATSSAFAVR